jgi:ABC-type uncharacterized transport system auxiliary subunit
MICLAGLAVVAAFLLCAGCATKTRETVTYHSLDYPLPGRDSPTAMPGTLMIYRFLIDPSVDTRLLVLTKSKDKKESLTYQRWSQNPSDMITDLIQRDLEASGLFEKTVGQFSSERYRYALEARIIDLRGVTGDGGAKAVLEVEASLTDFGAPLGAEKNILKQRYRIEAPCKDSSPQAIMDGLNQAVGELSTRLRNDIRSTIEKARIPAAR